MWRKSLQILTHVKEATSFHLFYLSYWLDRHWIKLYLCCSLYVHHCFMLELCLSIRTRIVILMMPQNRYMCEWQQRFHCTSKESQSEIINHPSRHSPQRERERAREEGGGRDNQKLGREVENGETAWKMNRCELRGRKGLMSYEYKQQRILIECWSVGPIPLRHRLIDP